MWNEPSKNQLEKIPKLYSQENVKDPKVRMKFFLVNMTWYITEFDGKDIMFGWVINDAYSDGAELGYVSFNELKGIKVRGMEVDRELSFNAPNKLKLLSEVKKQHFRQRGL